MPEWKPKKMPVYKMIFIFNVNTAGNGYLFLLLLLQRYSTLPSARCIFTDVKVLYVSKKKTIFGKTLCSSNLSLFSSIPFYIRVR